MVCEKLAKADVAAKLRKQGRDAIYCVFICRYLLYLI